MKRLSKLLAVMGIALAGALVPANKPLAADQNLKIDSKAFPDEAFREVVAFYDKNGDGYLSPGEREDVTAIASNYRAITSLKGIEYFTELTNINLGYSAKIEYIDLTKNTKLAYLTFDYYGKESIDLSRNTQLEYLSISWKNAPETGKWDLSANKELEDVSLYTNIGSIDLTNNTKLTHLVLQAPLEKLDLRKNTQLVYLHVDSYNKLRAIDLTKHKKLAYLTIHSDELESLNLDNNTNLVSLYLYTAKLKKLSLDKNLKLNDVWIDHNEYLEALDFSKQTKLTHLILQSTKIKDLKLNSDVLNDVHLYLNSGLKYLDLSHCAMLRDVYNSGKKEVTSIGVEYTKGDIDLYLNKEDKVVNNIVISTAIIDADRGDEIKLGKSITGGSVTGAGVYNTGDKVAIKVNPDTKNAYNVEAIYDSVK